MKTPLFSRKALGGSLAEATYRMMRIMTGKQILRKKREKYKTMKKWKCFLSSVAFFSL
jgi:hypothetical protein